MVKLNFNGEGFEFQYGIGVLRASFQSAAETLATDTERAKEEGAEAMQFVLCPQGPVADDRPPLGWSLSRTTREDIAEDVAALFRDTALLNPCRERNRMEMIRLRALLAGRSAP